MIYARMVYIVKHGGAYSEAFKSMIGVLTGDSASPGLWNIYFGDLAKWFPADNDDVELSGISMSHIEHADDVALFSTTAAGLQRRLNSFASWCSANSMVISVDKTKWMVFGPLPRKAPSLLVNGNVVDLVHEYKFVGIWFTSVKRHLFEKHYTLKASKAQGIAHASFTVDSMIGSLPPKEGIQLYMARVDPHLISGCEVVLDVNLRLVAKLEKPQKRYLRRLLGLHPRSMRAILFTETGLLPIRYRRAILALHHAKYWVGLPDDYYAKAAYMSSLRLSSSGNISWASDIRTVLNSFPIPVACPLSSLESREGIDKLISAVELSCESSMQGELNRAERTYLLRNRLETDEEGKLRTVVLRFRHYLRLISVPHRKAFTRFLLSDHDLAVEALRHPGRNRKYHIPRAWRLCRFCLLDVEDESHAALVCTAHPHLTPLRAQFFRDVFASQPSLRHLAMTRSADEFLGALLLDRTVTTRVAKFVHDVLQVFATKEMWVAPEHFNLQGWQDE
ncbi:RNA-directed DNA polymerase from mobile element jockey [Mycena sanguinolenta]|uniref:RNA-directed DNA polymerase from mobile element jockey n=1 Tax=Mycena sanguinolenta TaxID=230812 RepID=A0A8H6YS62_9AGAR|nr:RNA-directed DNA polymerase from mobile element jockey [Mycena sanguinolenta]